MHADAKSNHKHSHQNTQITQNNDKRNIINEKMR